MYGFDKQTRKVLDHIEWASKGGWVRATVPPEWENVANRSIILKLSVMDASGARRLTPQGRRKLHNLSVTSQKLLASLIAGPRRTIITVNRWDGKIFDLNDAGLVRLKKVSDRTYMCRVTTLGHSCEMPPPMPPPTHIVRMTYEGRWTPTRVDLKFSGSDAEAKHRMMLLWNTFLSADHPRLTAVAIRLSDQEKISRISQPKGSDPMQWKAFEFRH